MTNTFLIFFGCGLGGILRYWISISIHWLLGRGFPYGTLVVNATGSLLMGALFFLILERSSEIAPQLRAFLLVGLLGGYTTFSTFSIETLNLFENGKWQLAVLNIFLSVVLCITGVWIGAEAGRQ